MFIIIIFWLGCDKLWDFCFSCSLYVFPYSRLSSCIFFCLFALFHSWCSHARVFGKALVYELHISYNHTEWDFLLCKAK